MNNNFNKRNLNKSKSLARFLKKKRKKEELSLSKLEKKTKIKKSHLKALEEGNYENLPEEVYTRGFLRSLANLYQVDPVRLIDKYRQETDPKKPRSKKSVEFSPKTTPKPTLYITPRIITIGLGVLAGLFLLGYLYLEISGFAVAPKLAIEKPKRNNLQIQKDELRVKGSTDPGIFLTINKEPVPVDKNGHFDQKIKLQSGFNSLRVTASNKGERKKTEKLQIIVKSDKQNKYAQIY